MTPNARSETAGAPVDSHRSEQASVGSAENLRGAARSILADAIGSHLTEYGGGVAAWKDREPPERALADVVVRTLEPGPCVECGMASKACWAIYHDPESGRATGQWCCDKCGHIGLLTRRGGGISGI